MTWCTQSTQTISSNADNIQRLLAALLELDAIYRDPGGRRIVPTVPHLEAGGHNLLRTSLGYLDVLGYVGTYEAPIRYEELLSATLEFTLTGNLSVRILDLPLLIQLKEAANREKDRAVLPLLRSALKQRNRPVPPS